MGETPLISAVRHGQTDIINDNCYRPLCVNVAVWKALDEGKYDAKVREHADLPWINDLVFKFIS